MKKEQIPLHQFAPESPAVLPFRFEELVHINHYDTARPHRHNYYEVFIFTEGGGYHMIDFKSIPIHKGAVHFVSPGQVHQVNRAPGSMGMVAKFSREFFYSFDNKDMLSELPFLDDHAANPAIELSADERGEIEKLFEEIKAEFTGNGEGRDAMLRAYLQLILYKCKRVHQRQYPDNTDDNQGNSMIKKFNQLVEKHFNRVHQVNEYADMLAISAHHLNELTKKVSGKNASDVITERLLLESKRLLAHSELSIKEIAFEVGFNDPSYFSRFFNRKVGCTPHEFRMQVQNKA